MKAFVFALLTTYAVGMRFKSAQGVRFTDNFFEEANQGEAEQIQNAIKESEKQLGTTMNTPAFAEHAKRIETQNSVDYMNALEFKQMQREENEENEETMQSLKEARAEMKGKIDEEKVQ